MFCENCGSEIPDGATFCSSCGHKIKSKATPNKAASAVKTDKNMFAALVIFYDDGDICWDYYKVP